jgi:hypothetical protein
MSRQPILNLRLVQRLPFTNPELVQSLVNFRMDTPQVRPVHVTPLKEINQVANELGTEIILRYVALDQRPHFAEQLCTCTPTHDHGSKRWQDILRASYRGAISLSQGVAPGLSCFGIKAMKASHSFGKANTNNVFPRRAFFSHGAPSPAKPATQPPQPQQTARYCRPSSV